MYLPRWKNYFFEAHDKPPPEKWNLLRGVGEKTLSPPARLRLEWIIFYFTQGGRNAKATALYFGISRKTLHKWLRRFSEENLRSLEEESRRPKKVRNWMISWEEEANIKALREQNLELGKKKLKILYQKEYQRDITTWKIERVIRKHHLYPEPVEHKREVVRRRNPLPKVRIHEIKETLKEIKEFGFLWHIDAIILWWYGQTGCVLVTPLLMPRTS